jgi:hypothetical protein
MTSLSLKEKEILKAAVGDGFRNARVISRNTRFGFGPVKEKLKEMHKAGHLARKRLQTSCDGHGGYGYRAAPGVVGMVEGT